MKISFAKTADPAEGVVVIAVAEAAKGKPAKAASSAKSAKSARTAKTAGPALGRVAAALDARLGGVLRRAMSAGAFAGKREKTLQVLSPGDGRIGRVVMVGLGELKSLDTNAAERIGAAIYGAVERESSATVIFEDVTGAGAGAATLAAHIGAGAALKSYRFDKYRTKEEADAKPKLKELAIQCASAAEAARHYADLAAINAGIFLTRDLVSEPANVIFPDSFARRAKAALARDGVAVEILDGAALRKLGMGALLGVGQGSIHDSRVLVLRWNGARNKKAPPLAVVGKGVCFDTGGISLKQPGGMWDMKWDMAGAGVVVGVMQALARRKAKVNVVGLCGLVENMPDAKAQRPGDVVTSMSGQTIEVQNTDAEGRLVLADVLWYVQKRFKPRAIVDLATLTGAIIAALSEHYAGLFANNDDLAARLEAAGKAVGERLWRLPMGEEYDRELKSLIADMKNIGGARAGSITAAQFLQRFVKDVPWAHLDIAGVVWNEKGTALAAPGATGFGVRLLNRFIADNYEG
jgi:leucyl aminopeptidase